MKFGRSALRGQIAASRRSTRAGPAGSIAPPRWRTMLHEPAPVGIKQSGPVENSVEPLQRSGGSLRARHALAHVEHLDADHPAVAVEIEHDAWRHLFGDSGFDAFRAKPDKHRVGFWVIGSSDHRRAPRSKCTVTMTISSPSSRCTTRRTRAP